MRKRDLNRCVRCGMPETSERLDFDDFGCCKACRSSEQKMRISWATREINLRRIFDAYRGNRTSPYDCIVPISGGKDSAYQLFLLTKIYKLRPLAVTFSHNWFTDTGKRNLENLLEKTEVDHIQFTPNRGLVNRLARESLGQIGDSCWHCHSGVETFPLTIACKFNVPLLIYGESIAETSGKATYQDNPEFSIDYFMQNSAKVGADSMVCSDIGSEELTAFRYPSREEIEAVGLRRIFLGDYIFWDGERQTEFVKSFIDWEEDLVEGTYKRYKSVECIMPGVHDYAKYIKRGFGRATDFSSQDVRAGLMSLEQAREIREQIDPIRPAILDYYLDVTDTTEEVFGRTLEKHRGVAADGSLLGFKEMTKPNNMPLNSSVSRRLSQLNSNKVDEQRGIEIKLQRLFSAGGIDEIQTVDSDSYSSMNRCEIDNPHLCTITELREAFGSGKISATKIAEAYYRQYERIETTVNAWCSYNFRLLKKQSMLIDKEYEHRSSNDPLAGIPLGVKDIFNTREFATEMGSLSWAGFEPGNDARCVHQLKMQGAIIAGKTVTAEFGIDAPGKTKNPYDSSRITGTSSSGSAVAVATRMVPCALSSQTAGSTIRPASYAGIFGLKPTFGLIPRTGVLKTSDSLDHVCLMGISSRDIRLVLDAIRVKGPNYPFVNRAIDMHKPNQSAARPLRIGICITHTWNSASEYVRDRVIKFGETLASEGYIVDELSLVDGFGSAHEIHKIIYDKSVSYYFEHEYMLSRKLLQSETLEKIEDGLSISKQRYIQALETQNSFVEKIKNIFINYDFLIMNSTAEVAPPIEQGNEKPDPSLIWTLCNNPSISIPAFSGPSNLPFGLQVVAPHFADFALLSFCDQLAGSDLVPRVAPIPDIAI